MRKLLRKILKVEDVGRLEKRIILFLVLIAGLWGGLLGFLVYSFFDDSDIIKLEEYALPIPSTIYDKYGEVIAEVYLQKREPVSYNKIPPALIYAIVATEDPRFFKHHGVDLYGIIRAIFVNFTRGKVVEGGSTITQQLAKRLFTTGERSIFRKIKELWYAMKIERKYSKEQILELYLNQVYFGHGCYGVQSASKFYFNKNVWELDLGESALLAGIPNAPVKFSPYNNPLASRRRHWYVLNSMVKRGYITPEERDNAFNEFWQKYEKYILEGKPPGEEKEINKAPFFVSYVIQQLKQYYPEDLILKGGLKIYTSLDLKKQQIAEKYMKQQIEMLRKDYDNTVKELKKRVNQIGILPLIQLAGIATGTKLLESKELLGKQIRNSLSEIKDLINFSFSIVTYIPRGQFFANEIYKNLILEKKKNLIEGAFVLVNNSTGYIEAMVGGYEYNPLNQFNRAVQARRPTGSAFKPFIYSSAMESRKFTPATVISDSPVIYFIGNKVWQPKNYSGDFLGPVTLRDALKLSINVVTIKLLERLGIEPLKQTMKKFFDLSEEEVQRRLPLSLAAALGVFEATPLEMVEAFTTFPNEGVKVKPIAVLKVADRYGRILNDFEAERLIYAKSKAYKRILDPQTAFIMTSMLQSVVDHGTGLTVRTVGKFYGPCGGKTGTTSSWCDAWFIGFTKEYTAAVWFGFDKGTETMGRGKSGGVIAAPVFGQIFRDIYLNRTPQPFRIPPGITTAMICTESGLLATPHCPKTRLEYFIEGTGPLEYCTLHEKQTIKQTKHIESLIERIGTINDELMENVEELTNTWSIDTQRILEELKTRQESTEQEIIQQIQGVEKPQLPSPSGNR